MSQSKGQKSLSEIKIEPIRSLIPQTYQNNHLKQQKPFENISYKLLAAMISVLASEYLISNTIIYKIISGISPKTVLNDQNRKQWINQQLKRIRKTMIRYNTIVFSSKVVLDEYYQQTIRRNQHYHQSSSLLNYKIGALTGLIAYIVNIPINQFQHIQAANSKIVSNMKYFQRLSFIYKQFLSIEGFKRMINSFSSSSMIGVMIYRTIYFGTYQKLISKYEGPVSEYLIAPVLCSTLSLIVSPLDQIKLLQMTSHKDKSFFQVINQKGISLWNLSPQKIVSSIAKQSLSMISFVLGQKLVHNILNQVENH